MSTSSKDRANKLQLNNVARLLEAAEFLDALKKARETDRNDLHQYAKSPKSGPAAEAKPTTENEEKDSQEGRGRGRPMLDRRRCGGCGTREVHNKLEKNRRAHMKECFEILKKKIPNIDDKKVSNLSILRCALRVIQANKRQEKELEQENQRLKQEQQALEEKLAEGKKKLTQMNVTVDLDMFVKKEDANSSTSTATACDEDIFPYGRDMHEGMKEAVKISALREQLFGPSPPATTVQSHTGPIIVPVPKQEVAAGWADTKVTAPKPKPLMKASSGNYRKRHVALMSSSRVAHLSRQQYSVQKAPQTVAPPLAHILQETITKRKARAQQQLLEAAQRREARLKRRPPRPTVAESLKSKKLQLPVTPPAAPQYTPATKIAVPLNINFQGAEATAVPASPVAQPPPQQQLTLLRQVPSSSSSLRHFVTLPAAPAASRPANKVGTTAVNVLQQGGNGMTQTPSLLAAVPLTSLGSSGAQLLGPLTQLVRPAPAPAPPATSSYALHHKPTVTPIALLAALQQQFARANTTLQIAGANTTTTPALKSTPLLATTVKQKPIATVMASATSGPPTAMPISLGAAGTNLTAAGLGAGLLPFPQILLAPSATQLSALTQLLASQVAAAGTAAAHQVLQPQLVSPLALMAASGVSLGTPSQQQLIRPLTLGPLTAAAGVQPQLLQASPLVAANQQVLKSHLVMVTTPSLLVPQHAASQATALAQVKASVKVSASTK